MKNFIKFLFVLNITFISDLGYANNGNLIFEKFSFDGVYINEKYNKSTLSEKRGTRLGNCFFAESKRNKIPKTYYQVMDNKVAIISTENKNIKSYAGISVGDKEELIYKKHSSEKFQKKANDYGDPKKDYIIVFWRDKNKNLGLRYDISNKKVISISIGNENLTLMEGCA